MCFDGAVGAARGFGRQQRMLSLVLLETAFCCSSQTLLLIVDNVAHSRQYRALLSVMAVCLCQRYDD